MKKIFIIAGGYSKEREISIKTANSVYKELDKVGGSIIAILHLFSNIFLISIILLIPIFVSFHVTIVSILVILGLFLPVKLINFYFYKLGKRFTDESNIFSKLFFYAVSMYKNISANSANKITIDDIHNSYKKINKFEIINKLLNSSISEVLNTLSIFFVFTIFAISSYYNLSIPEISAVLYSFLRIFPHVNNSISMINVIQSSRAGFELIEKLKKERYSSIALSENWLKIWRTRMPESKILNDAEDVKIKKKFIQSIGQKITNKLPKFQYMGLFKILIKDYKKLGKNFIKIKNKKIDMTSFINLMITDHKIKFSYVKTNSKWYEIDTPSDVKNFKKINFN